MKSLVLKYSWLIGGILLGLSYPGYEPLPTGLLAWFALVPFLLVNRKNQSFKSYLFKAALLSIVTLLVDVWWLNYYSFQAYLVCVFSQFLFVLLPLLFFYFLNKRFGWRRSLIVLPFFWTLSDYLAHQMPHGMQVYLLAYTQANNIWLIQFADKTGMWGVGFWIVMMNSLIALAIVQGKVKNYAFVFLWLLMPLFYSFWVLKINPESVTGVMTKTSKVSLIQTNIDSYASDRTVFIKTFDQIASLADSAVRNSEPDLLILPEAAFPISLFQDTLLFDFVKKAISSWQTSVAIGYVEYPDLNQKQVFRNNAMVFTPQLAMFWDSLKIEPEDVKVYQKQFGLPFVELMPYFENSLTSRGTKMERGKEPLAFDYKNFENENFRVGLTICWEQMYPEKIAALVNENAEFIALMNNDAWFGKSAGAKQLLSFTRLRAIENRRSIARCSNGGLSCFVDPFGTISGAIPWFTANITTKDVSLVRKKSFYTKHPHAFLIAVAFLFLLLITFFEIQIIKNQ